MTASARRITDDHKFLGVHTEEHLTWAVHTTAVIEKAQQRLCFLSTLRKYSHLLTECYTLKKSCEGPNFLRNDRQSFKTKWHHLMLGIFLIISDFTVMDIHCNACLAQSQSRWGWHAREFDGRLRSPSGCHSASYFQVQCHRTGAGETDGKYTNLLRSTGKFWDSYESRSYSTHWCPTSYQAQ